MAVVAVIMHFNFQPKTQTQIPIIYLKADEVEIDLIHRLLLLDEGMPPFLFILIRYRHTEE